MKRLIYFALLAVVTATAVALPPKPICPVGLPCCDPKDPACWGAIDMKPMHLWRMVL